MALAAVATLSQNGVESFQPMCRVTHSPCVLTSRWGGPLRNDGVLGLAHSQTQICRRGASLKSSKTDKTTVDTAADSREDAQDAHTPGMLEAGGGPTVILDDPPTDVYSKAITRTLFWVSLSLLFGIGIWSTVGAQTAEEFYAGYLVEQSLSVDNLFVFLLLFDYFKVPMAAQDKVLNWGIYGAVVMRAIMIGLGAAALHEFHAILLVFAGILVYSSVKVLFGGEDEEEEDMSENQIVNFSKNLIDSVDVFDGDKFFTFVDGVRKATPLFICMVAVEISDVVFAVDSIPAVFGVTENPLVVFTSNMFAIMGLRSLYTILSKAASDLEYLEPAVAVVLGFIGGKMIAEYFGYGIPTEVALSVVATLLAGGVGLSLWSKNQDVAEVE